MTTIQQLIQETRERAKTLSEVYALHKENILQLIDGCRNEQGRKLGINYYPRSYEGRKIGFGVPNSDEKEFESMVIALVNERQIESFMKRLTEVELPLHINGKYSDHQNFFF